MDLLGPIVIVPVLMYARVANQDGLDDNGTFRHVCLCAVQVLRARERAGNGVSAIRAGIWGERQVFEYLGLAEEPAEEPGVRVLPAFSHGVEFDHVAFGYDPETPILRTYL